LTRDAGGTLPPIPTASDRETAGRHSRYVSHGDNRTTAGVSLRPSAVSSVGVRSYYVGTRETDPTHRQKPT